jgi:flagellar biosynthesis protein FlhF
VEITAVAGDDAGSPAAGSTAMRGDGEERREPSDADVSAALRPIYQQLLQNQVADELARRMVAEVERRCGGQPTAERVRAVLAEVIERLAPRGAIELPAGGRRRVALVGPPGSGKTTTLAKLAAQFRLRLKRSVGLLSLDMHRLAAHEQLARYAEIIGAPLATAQTLSAAKASMQALESSELVLVDTCGVGRRDRGRFARLAALLRAVRPHEVHLVLPAAYSPAAQERAAALFAPLGVTRVVLTHVDEAVGCGVVLSALQRAGWGLSYVSDGQRVPTDLHEACGSRLAELLLAVR